MPWQPLPRIAFAVATYPFTTSKDADLPLQIGDELYVIEETSDGNWLRGYLVAPPSLLSGLTSIKGQTLEARVFSGIFPRNCVEVREMLGESEETEDEEEEENEQEEEDEEQQQNTRESTPEDDLQPMSDSAKGGLTPPHYKRIQQQRKQEAQERKKKEEKEEKKLAKKVQKDNSQGIQGPLSVPAERDPSGFRPPAPVPMLKVGDETPTSATEPLIDEIASCLREWHSKNLHELLLSRQYARLDELSQLITSLNLSRQQFLYNVLTAHELEQLREKTVWDLVKVNKLCGSEVIVRDPAARGRVLTGDDSVIEVTRLQSLMTLLDEPPHNAPELSALHHLLLEVKGFAGGTSEARSLVVSLVSKPKHEQRVAELSESFTIELPSDGSLGSLTEDSKMKTLFTNLAAHDIADGPSAESDLYLVVKVLAAQQVLPSKPLSRTGTGASVQNTGDSAPPPPSTGSKGSRRSLMWGSKAGKPLASARPAYTNKMDSLAEHSGPRPRTGEIGSRDGRSPGSSSDVSARTVNRTVGVGILKLNPIIKVEDGVEQVINVWSPAPAQTHQASNGEGWDPLIRQLMDSPTGHFEQSKRAERIQVHLRAFNHQDADSLIKSTPTLLLGVNKTQRMGFAGAPTQPRSDIYLTINGAALARQNLLSRWGGSATVFPSSFQGANLQITMEVRKASGERIERCIHPSSNSTPLTTFRTVAAERGESWNQTVRLCIAPEDVPTSHVVMFLSDLPGSPCAVAHMPLWDQQAFVRDGPHGLLLYKIDEHTATAQPGPAGRGGYLSTVWTPRGKDEYSADVTGPLAVLRIESYLSSTKFSQDRVILGLLKWKDLQKDNIPAMLRQFIFVPEIEVVKLLSDVLDALFGILVEFSGNDEYEDLVFTALVRVLGIVHDRRFNLGPLVDHYAENRFNYPFATTCLIRSFTRLLENPTEPETARKLRATFKVVRHILKFIAQARDQQKEKEAGIGITSSSPGFSRQLRTIFKALDAMMHNPSPLLVGSQTLAVQHFHTWLPELTDLLSTEEVLHIAIDFMDSCTDVKGKLILFKLVLIINYSKLEIFAHPDQQSALSTNTVRWISPHWGHTAHMTEQWREQIRLCCSILASQMDHLAAEIPDHIPKIVESYLAVLAAPMKSRKKLSLLFPSSYPFPTKVVSEDIEVDEALAELAAVLSSISTSSSGMQLELADGNLADILENLLRVHMSVLSGDAFPSNWLSVHVSHHKSTMQILQDLAAILLDSFLPDPEDGESFNFELWKMFFTTLLKLVGSSSLALETYPEQKRRAVWKIAGDVREHGAELLRRTWEAIGWDATPEDEARYGLSRIGGFQVQYVPALVGPIVELCLSVHEGLRRMAVEVLQTMIVSEWTLSEDLSVIQTEMIDCLDNFFRTKPLTDSILQKLFVPELMERYHPMAEVTDEPLYQAIQEMVGTVDEFLDLLAAVYNGDGSNEASHIINRLRLMEFLRDMQKEEIFIEYVQQLAALQAAVGNYTEAGLALRLHADLYEWDSTKQTPALEQAEFPAQTHFERKEKIYFDMIKHFEDGESWSNALTAYKELQDQYENNIYDFAKLARTQHSIATIYETISKSEKLIPRYFRVAFKGLGFPSAVRDKEFIYQGSPLERAPAFADRIQEEYPKAHIVTAGDVDEVEGQFLLISPITAHRDLDHQVFQRARVPHIIRDYLLSSHPQTFSVTTKRDTSGAVHEHYAEKTLFTTAEPFPTILRRSEIVELADLRMSAHDTALERIVRKTQEMTMLEKQITDGNMENAQLLVDAVAVSVGPASESSVFHYRQLLPQPSRSGSSVGDDEEEEDSEEDDSDDEEELELEPKDKAIKMALVDHAIMLKRCLALFARISIDPVFRRCDELQRGKSTAATAQLVYKCAHYQKAN